MQQPTWPRGARRALVIAAAALFTLICALPADSAQPAFSEHRHQPIDLPSRPIVSRITLPLNHPRRLMVNPDGKLLIADWGAGKVFSVDANGEVAIVAERLDEPAGLACDADGNIYIATHARGLAEAGSIVRVTTAGEQSTFAAGLTGPTALAFNPRGQLHVANFHDNTISRVDSDGRTSPFAEGIPQPSALVFDSAGVLYVASSAANAVFRVGTNGEVTPLSSDFAVPSDLAFDQEGHLVVANYAARELTYVQTNGNTRPFAIVPKGTIAFVFDRDNNLLLANWDHPFVIKVTSNLNIPCPHCDKPIPVHLRGNLEPLDDKTIDERLY